MTSERPKLAHNETPPIVQEIVDARQHSAIYEMKTRLKHLSLGDLFVTLMALAGIGIAIYFQTLRLP